MLRSLLALLPGIAVAGSLLLPSLASAQAAQATDAAFASPPDDEAAWLRTSPFEVSLFGEFGTDKEIDEPGLEDVSEFSETRFGVEVNTGYPLIGEELFAIVSFQYERHTYDFETLMPFESVDLFNVNGGLFYAIDDRWAVIGLGGITWAADEDGELGDGVTATGFGAVVYEFSPTLTIGLAFIYSTGLGDDDDFLAIPFVEWDITDRLHLRVRDGFLLGYEVTEDGTWVVDTNFSFRSKEFDIANAPAAAPLPALDAVEDQYFEITAGVRYTHSSGVFVRGYVGAQLAREFTFIDALDNEVELDVESGLIFGAEGGWRF